MNQLQTISKVHINLIITNKFQLFTERKQLKKLFIPLLLVLKIFKLKLLLFLPLILGLASFKNLLGFLALIIPGAIAYFNFCKPGFKQNGGKYVYNMNFEYTINDNNGVMEY